MTKESKEGHQIRRTRRLFLYIMTKFVSMWDGNFGRIGFDRDCVKLLLGPFCPIQSAYAEQVRQHANLRRQRSRDHKNGSYQTGQNRMVRSFFFSCPKKNGLCASMEFTCRHSMRHLPRTEKAWMHQFISDALVFSTLHTSGSYWIVETGNTYCDETAFTSHYRPYRFENCHLDFPTVLAQSKSHQCDINSVRVAFWSHIFWWYYSNFRTCKWAYIPCLHRAFKLLNSAGVVLSLSKCDFFTKNANYLGHIMRSGNLKLADNTIDENRDLNHCRT